MSSSHNLFYDSLAAYADPYANISKAVAKAAIGLGKGFERFVAPTKP
jgi:hypothetical protein